jgi:hypothetical protein
VISTLILLGLLAGLALVVDRAAAFLNRSIPTGHLLILLLSSCSLLAPGIARDETIAPVDHLLAIPPWASPSHSKPTNPYLSDVATQFVPWAKAVRQAWKSGSLPFLDPWNGCGTPLAANSQSAAYSPFTIVSFLLPLARSLTWLAIARLFLAATGMWLWARECGASRGGALFAAISLSFSLSFTDLLLFPHTAVACFWPWALFAYELIRREPSAFRPIGAMTLVVVLMALGGHPESLASGCLLVGLWAAARVFIGGPSPGGSRALLKTALAIAFGLGLSAFALLPAAMAIQASNRYVLASAPFRGLSLPLWPHRPMRPLGLLTPFFPAALGDALHSSVIPGGGGNVIETAQGYFGIVAWVCALCVFRPGSRRAAVTPLLAAIMLLALAAAVGQWPVAEIVALLPGLRLMLPLRFYAWMPVAGAALAALELDRLVSDLRQRRGPAGLVIVAAAFSGAAVVVFLTFRHDYVLNGQAEMQARRLAVTLGVLCVLVLATVLLRRKTMLYVAAVTALCWLELVFQARGLYAFHPSRLLYSQTPLTRFLAAQQKPFRVVGAGAVLFPNTNVLAGVEDIRTHDPVERRDYVEFLDATCGYDPQPYFKTVENLNASALDFLNVRFLLTVPGSAAPGPRWRPVYDGPDGIAFENRGVLPRAFVPRRVAYVASGAQSEGRREAGQPGRDLVARLAASEDWGLVAFVESDRFAEVANGHARVLDYREIPNGILVRLAAPEEPRPPLVVVSLVNDGGWGARDERGTKVEVLRVNGPFLGLQAPAGRHTITLRYRPPGLRAGCLVSLAAAALAGLVWLRSRGAGPHRSPGEMTTGSAS